MTVTTYVPPKTVPVNLQNSVALLVTSIIDSTRQSPELCGTSRHKHHRQYPSITRTLWHFSSQASQTVPVNLQNSVALLVTSIIDSTRQSPEHCGTSRHKHQRQYPSISRTLWHFSSQASKTVPVNLQNTVALLVTSIKDSTRQSPEHCGTSRHKHHRQYPSIPRTLWHFSSQAS
ncbi:hypothetical protein ACOMHN_062032 [Nucella lapillus]